MSARLIALITAAFLSVAAAQRPAPKPPAASDPVPTSKTQAQVLDVTVTGCLRGTRLVPTPGVVTDTQLELLATSEFTLQGPRDLMRQLTRDHDGHEETITGVAIIPPQPSDARIDTKSVTKGQTTIIGGVRDARGQDSSKRAADVTGPVRIRVQSATHRADHCTERH
jgi:hypothetical protein